MGACRPVDGAGAAGFRTTGSLSDFKLKVTPPRG